MKTLAALCVRRPIFTWVLVLACVVLGLDGLGKMPVERYPNVDFGFVGVSISAPGMSPEQVESEISARVEGALGTVSGLERLDSVSSEGLSLVTAQFVLEKDQAVAANDVRDRISRLADELPTTARPARVETYNANATPIVLIALESSRGTRTPLEIAELAETSVRRELQSIRGVGEVRLVGAETRALTITLDPLRLRTADLTAQEVQSALARENLEAPGGRLIDGDATLGVRLLAKARTATELEQVIVAKRGDSSVRIGDIGHVEDGAMPSESRATVSGRAAVIVAVTKQPGENTVRVTDEVRSRLDVVRGLLPDGVEARVIQDNSEDVRAAVHAVTEHLVLGAVLAAVVVLLFLRSWRATLIAGVAIPASVVGTFAVANALGMSLNLLSLLGLTLAVGIVIDDAIVVLENVVRIMQTRRMNPRDAAVEATREIGLAVLATTLSLVAVFLPVAMMAGIVGRYLAPFGITMSASILISMGVAFTLTPMLCSRWLKADVPHDANEQALNVESPTSAELTFNSEEHAAAPSAPSPPLVTTHAESHDGYLERHYGRVIEWLLGKRWLAAIGILATFAAIVPAFAALPATFVPTEDTSRLAVYVRLPESAPVERTVQVAEEIAGRLRNHTEVTDTVVTTTSAREAIVKALLAKRGLQTTMIARARTELAQAYAGQPLLLMVGPSDDADPGPDSAAIQFVVRGADLTELTAVTSRLLEEAKKIPGTVDHGLSTAGRQNVLSMKVDRAHANQLGVSQAEIGSALALVDRPGVDLGTVRDPHSAADVALKVRLKVESDELSNEDLVRALTVRSERGTLLSLADIATIDHADAPGTIRRVGRQRQITVFMNTVPGTSDTDVIQTLQRKLKEIEPTGRYRAELVGNAKEMEKTFSAFLVAIALSFVFMYLVLAAQFESWIHPVTILVSLPLTIPFGLVSLLIGGQSLNLFSALGFLVLFGVVKKNSILQVDRILQLRAEGLTRGDAVVAACRDRLRPILMTTLAFVAGMIPLVVSSGAGAATNRAIAVGIMGGQTLSLALTLLITPIVYTWLDDLPRLWRGKSGSANSGPRSPRPPTHEINHQERAT